MPRLVDGAGDGEVVLVQDLQPMWLNPGSAPPSGVLAFMNAYSFAADRRDKYIHDADLRLPM